MKQNSKLLRNANQMKAKANKEITHRKWKNRSKDTYKWCENCREINDKTHTNDLETKEIMREIQQKWTAVSEKNETKDKREKHITCMFLFRNAAATIDQLRYIKIHTWLRDLGD